MRRVLCSFIFICSGLNLYAADRLAEAQRYLQEQDQEKAFRTYLQALAEAKTKAAPPASEEERQLYCAALKLYLDGAHAPRETALELLQSHADHVQKHPEFLELQLVLATAYANLGRFDDFFTQFYPAYCAYPSHYLSYKTKAILHIKLFERCRSLAEREVEKGAIRSNVQLALHQYSHDIGLYKLWLLFADDKNKSAEVEACLNKIFDTPMIISRSDLPFFAQQTLDARQFKLTQRLIDKGRNWYPYSRCLDSTQQALNEFKRKTEQAP